MIILGGRFKLEEVEIMFYVATPTCSISMPGYQVAVDPAEVSYTEWGKGDGVTLDSEAFSFQEVSNNTQGRHICI